MEKNRAIVHGGPAGSPAGGAPSPMSRRPDPDATRVLPDTGAEAPTIRRLADPDATRLHPAADPDAKYSGMRCRTSLRSRLLRPRALLVSPFSSEPGTISATVRSLSAAHAREMDPTAATLSLPIPRLQLRGRASRSARRMERFAGRISRKANRTFTSSKPSARDRIAPTRWK